MQRRTLGCVVGLLLVASCDGSGPEITPALKPLSSCGSVEQTIKDAALEQMNRQLDASLQSALQMLEYPCYGPGDSRGWDEQGPYYAGSMDGATNSGSVPSPSAKGASAVSTTNNQVAGVDEADFVKNDNKYIYVVSGTSLRILQAWPAPRTREIAKVAIDGTPKRLFVYGDRALVYSALDSATAGGVSRSSSPYTSSECTYGYGCSFTGDGQPMQITLLDISDRTAPRKIRVIRTTGSYVNARRVGKAVHTVVSAPGISFPSLSTWPEGYNRCAEDGQATSFWQVIRAFEDLRKENRQKILDTRITDWLPAVEDQVLEGSGAGTRQELLAGCGGFYRAAEGDGGQFTTLLSLDMTQSGPGVISTNTIISAPGAVYASDKALYISVPHQQTSSYGWYAAMDGEQEASTVHKFALDNERARVGYSGSGVVKGHVLNQFAMYEQDGYLSIATTSGYVPNPGVHSTLSVLQQRGSELRQVGQLDNLAPSEDIRSVRFDGAQAFVVTFKKTDPLFVFDLSDPRAPRVTAELKIPGFSTYMHMMDDTHLLTIGYDADDQGSFAWFTGVMMQIFDVSDMARPVRTHKEVIGTRGSSSAALNNHLAFNYFGVKDLLALPMTVCEGSAGGGSYGTNMTFSGLMVFDVTADSGFSKRGQVSHPAGSGISCSNWWTDAESQVERSIFMDNYVFSISRELVKVNHLDALSTDLVSLPID